MRCATVLAAMLGVMTVVGVGCKARDPSAAVVTRAAAKQTIPMSSPLSRVAIGQTMKEVEAVTGQATESRGHLMGKNFVPFYFGRDRYRTTWYFPGQGRVIFNTTAKVMKIEYDPTEDGHKD